MAATYLYETTVSFGPSGEPTAELDVKVRYSVSWGAPERGPTYRHGGLPADPPEITDIELVSVDGKPSGWSMYLPDAEVARQVIDKLGASDRDLDAMLESAAEDLAAEQEAAAEQRWDARREAAWES